MFIQSPVFRSPIRSNMITKLAAAQTRYNPMRNLFLISIFLGLLSTAAHAQIGPPSPSPTPADDDVVKISTNLIQLDVTVTDRKGKAITDLRPEAIEI